MDIQIWDMIVKTERQRIERQAERRARLGRPHTSSPFARIASFARGLRGKPLSRARVQPQEAP